MPAGIFIPNGKPARISLDSFDLPVLLFEYEILEFVRFR